MKRISEGLVSGVWWFPAAALWALAGVAGAASMYKWTDPATGEIIYSDQPPPATIKSVEEKRVVLSSIQTSLPYSIQHAVKRNPISLYVTNCGEFCDKSREYLKKRGLPFSEKNPQQGADMESFKKASSGAMEVPLLVVGQQTVKGFDAVQYDAALSAAGYPKISIVSLGATAPAKPPPVATRASEPARPEAAAQADAGTLPKIQAAIWRFLFE